MSCGCCQNNPEFEMKQEKSIDFSKIQRVLEQYKEVKGSLIVVLQKVQDIVGYLPENILYHIAAELNVRPAKIIGVATFYSQFRLKPVGKHIIMLCQGTACHVNGSKQIEEALVAELGIEDGETTTDNMFTLENVACLGCCSLAPVMMIDGEAYGNLDPNKAKKVIRGIYKTENPGGAKNED